MATQRIGYCTNVHAGATWQQTQANLQRHALAVRAKFAPDRQMGIGLWLSAQSAEALVQDQGVPAFAQWLADNGLLPFTMNGFPYGDFHQTEVKYKVYEPTWWQPARLSYTQILVDILHQLLPPGEEGSISTLPIAWGHPRPSPEQLAAAGRQLRQLATYLAEHEERTGRLIYICLEPEPGCVFDTTRGAVNYFREYLLDDADADRVRRYVRICHDVCHSAVMFEPQREVFTKLSEAGIEVGKIQVSAAVVVDFDALPPAERASAWQQLSAFDERRYLHQTSVREETGKTHFHVDLPDALNAHPQAALARGQWRVHFHVPVYLAEFGKLQTSQAEIVAALNAAREHARVSHYEVETYAWNVLPVELQQAELAAGIAREMQWFEELVKSS
jgi:hypothetical protein